MHAPPSGAGKLHVQVLVFLGPAACWMSQPCWFLGLGDRVGNKQVGNGGSDLEESEFWTWEAVDGGSGRGGPDVGAQRGKTRRHLVFLTP